MASNIDIVTYQLPTSKDTTVFGPAFWSAFQDLANRVPCDGCKDHAKSFVSFWHDLVNLHTGKPLFDKANFDKVMKQIQEVQGIRQKNVDRKILVGIAVVVVAILIIVAIKK